MLYKVANNRTCHARSGTLHTVLLVHIADRAAGRSRCCRLPRFRRLGEAAVESRDQSLSPAWAVVSFASQRSFKIIPAFSISISTKVWSLHPGDAGSPVRIIPPPQVGGSVAVHLRVKCLPAVLGRTDKGTLGARVRTDARRKEGIATVLLKAQVIQHPTTVLLCSAQTTQSDRNPPVL